MRSEKIKPFEFLNKRIPPKERTNLLPSKPIPKKPATAPPDVKPILQQSLSKIGN
jgi:hypothetical protein